MNSSGMPPKFCPRCGAFYRNMPSATCPTCFAHLEVLEADDARQVEATVDELSKNPEFVEAKAVEDEKYKEQAFGGCMGVALITLATLLIAALIVYAGMHRKLPPPPVNSHVSFDAPDTVLPKTLAGVARTKLVVRQRNASMPFTTLRGVYGTDLEVFAATAPLPAAEHEAFRLFASMAPDGDQGSLKSDEVVAHGADYIVVSKSVETIQRAINEVAQ
jgi:hypothetical protein